MNYQYQCMNYYLRALMKTAFNHFVLTILLLLLCQSAFSAANDLPDMGSSSNRVLPLNLEQELGDNYMRIIRRELDINSDPLIRTYINQLGFRLVAASPDAEDRQFYFFVVNDPVVNAFAMPGGYIGINSGLIKQAKSEDELAGVIAHEIAHVTQRHIARRIEQQQQLSLPSMLALLGSILIMTQDGEAGMAAMTGLQAGAQQVMINHTRANESEADRVGITTLANAGFNPTGMTRFFEKMLQLSRYSGQRLAFLSTHPLSQRRITESRERARKLSFIEQIDNDTFRLMQQRLMGTMNQDFNALNRDYEKYLSNVRADRISDELRYGQAVIQFRLGNVTQALEQLTPLFDKDPENPVYLVTMAEVLTTLGRGNEALEILQSPLDFNPGNDAYTIAYAKALVSLDKTKDALDLLYEHLPKLDKEPFMYQLIADVQSKHGLYKEVHESTGLYLYHSGDLQGALAQFKLAISGRSDDPYFNARLSARIRKVQKEILLLK